MSEGYPTAAQKEALRLICAHGRLDIGELGAHLVRARRSSGNPGFAPAIARMAGTLTWRLHGPGSPHRNRRFLVAERYGPEADLLRARMSATIKPTSKPPLRPLPNPPASPPRRRHRPPRVGGWWPRSPSPRPSDTACFTTPSRSS